MDRFSEVVERALHGPFMPEAEFDSEIFTIKIADVVDKQGIVYDGDQVVVADEMNADGYAAGAPEAVKLARKLMQ